LASRKQESSDVRNAILFRPLARTGEMVSLTKQVVLLLVEQDIGVLGMKPMCDLFVLVSGTVTAVHTARDGKYELYKTTHHFDGTDQNPQWLG
jgi:hypothetical protein